MSDWLDLSDNANCFKQTYVQGFVDVSGGSIITRGTGGGLVIGGDSSLNGTVYLGDSIFVRSDGMVAPGTADNGATSYNVDVSGNADNGATSYDISGNADNGAEVSSVSIPYDASFSQLGNNIYGLRSGDATDFYNISTAVSADAKTVVVGTVSDQTSRRGYARVFRIASDGSWNQLGNDLIPDYNGNVFIYGGYSVAMSADGTVVVLGAPFYSVNNINDIRGQIKIFVYNTVENTWDAKKTYFGIDHNSPYSTTYLRLGRSVAVSRNGNTITVVAGDPAAKPYTKITGDAYMVQSTDGGTNWPTSLSSIGYWLYGNNQYADYSQIGDTNLVAISGDGNVIAVGCPKPNSPTSTSRRTLLTKVGTANPAAFDGGAPYPTALSLNGAGDVMVVSASGPAQIIIYRRSDSSWTKSEFVSVNTSDPFTSSVSGCINGINWVGDIIALQTVGAMRMYQYKTIASQNEFNQYNTTSTIYEPTDPLYTKLTLWPLNSTWNSTSKYWVQIGPDLNSVGSEYNISQALAMSADGTIVVSGGAGTTGHVRIYEITNTKAYSDVSGGYYDVSVFGGYNNDGLTSAALYVNGDTDISGGLTVSGDVSFNAGNLFVAGDLSLNGNLYINSYATNSIGADAIDSTVDIEFANKLSVSTADISFNANNLRVAADLSYNETADPSHNFTDISVNLAANLKVPANIAIVDGSNGTVYGSYLTFTNKDATAYYNVGKSASGIFNIVDQANAGVYLASGGTSFVGTSDARLKTNVAPLESATDKIMALNPCTYQWKSEVESAADGTDPNTKPHVGFIAQEVEKIMPELVHSIDHPAGPDYKGVNTTDMIPYLVRTIQEQNVMIKSLHKEIDILENV